MTGGNFLHANRVCCRRGERAEDGEERMKMSSHLHMISCVSSTLHISGFLSWPS